MNYEKIYNNLVYKRQYISVLSDNDIFEEHHIIPKSIRPDLQFVPSNIVRLTLKEHFVCHKLLEKIYAQKFGKNSLNHRKMIAALYMMSNFKRYGKRLTAKQYAVVRMQYKEAISDILKTAWQNYPKDKMAKLSAIRKINSSGKNNPMYGKSWKTGKTEEEILQHSINTSLGLRKRSQKDKERSIQKMLLTNSQKSDEEKQKTIQKRNQSRKDFYDNHPDKWLERNKNVRKANIGKRKMFKNGEQPKVVKASEIQTYLDNGWKFTLHEKDTSNPAYGRKWMHLKGSDKKDDRVYVKPDQINYYLSLGYVFGIKDK